MPNTFRTNGFQKSHTANANTSSFAARPATTTEPTGTGVIELDPTGSGEVPARVALIPYGLGSDNDVFDMLVYGWRLIGTLWVPTKLLKVTCTISAAVGVAGAPVLATERFADTIASASIGVSNVSYELYSTTDDTPAHLIVSTEGCRKLEILFDQTTGTPTMNCLVAPF